MSLQPRRRTQPVDGGFTLVELMIVMVILSILGLTVILAVQHISSMGAQSACASDLKTIETATGAYDAQMGHYPTGIQNLYSSQVSPVNGKQVGPWLKDQQANGAHYTISVSSGSGQVSVLYPDGSQHPGCTGVQ